MKRWLMTAVLFPGLLLCGSAGCADKPVNKVTPETTKAMSIKKEGNLGTPKID